MIKLTLSIEKDDTQAEIDLPNDPPSMDLLIKAVMACQFDISATNAISEQIRIKYGEEYYNKTVNAMAEVIKSFREIIQNSMALDPESPAVPTVYMMPRGSK